MKTKRNDILRTLTVLGIIIISAFLLSLFFFKLDLTAEKRHSLTPGTITLLEDLDDRMFVRCYLHGEFPANYKHMEQAIRERLDEFRDYSDGKIEYEFIDPYESGDKKIIAETEKALYEKGLRFSNIPVNENGAQGSKLIWPAAIIQFRNKEYPVQFLKSDMPSPNDAMINNSINNLEYELTSNIRKITRDEKPAIAILQGHGELDRLHMADFEYGLSSNYDIEFMRIDSQVNAFSDKISGVKDRVNRYQALIIAGPDSVVSDKDRVIIDQFIMNGGKVLWLLDALKVNTDSLRSSGFAMAPSNENGLYEMLFEYGVRLNRVMVIDFQGAPVILDDGPKGNQRSYVERTNYYSPLILSPPHAHPITSNLDPVKLEFAGSLDSVNQNPEILKIPLFFSSELSKELRTPVRVDFERLRYNQEYFQSGNKPNQIMAMILEGSFPSAFRDILGAKVKNSPEFAFREKSVPTKMIIVADRDIARNEITTRDGKPLPFALGYDPTFKRVLYDNKEFLLNCMNYLMDDNALITVRSRSIELRELDMAAVQENRTSIKLQNTVLPLLVIGLFGVVHWILRKRKWTRPLAS